MGVWDATANGGMGQWRAELLSEDQEGLNVKEVERYVSSLRISAHMTISFHLLNRVTAHPSRIRSEHPPAERDSVVRRGRILGGLQPTRAFGDARYKVDGAHSTSFEAHSAYHGRFTLCHSGLLAYKKNSMRPFTHPAELDVIHQITSHRPM